MVDTYLGFFEHQDMFAVADFFQINAPHKHIEYDKKTGVHTRTSIGAAYKVVRDVFEGGELYASTTRSTQIGDELDAISDNTVLKNGNLTLLAINKTTSPAKRDFKINGKLNSRSFIHRVLAFDGVNKLKTFAMEDEVLSKVNSDDGTIVLPLLSINRIDVSQE